MAECKIPGLRSALWASVPAALDSPNAHVKWTGDCGAWRQVTPQQLRFKLSLWTYSLAVVDSILLLPSLPLLLIFKILGLHKNVKSLAVQGPCDSAVLWTQIDFLLNEVMCKVLSNRDYFEPSRTKKCNRISTLIFQQNKKKRNHSCTECSTLGESPSSPLINRTTLVLDDGSRSGFS